MTTSIQNFYELHVNLCMHMHDLESYLKTIGSFACSYGFFIVTLDGNCWIVDPKTFNGSLDEKKYNADGKIARLYNVPKNITKIKIPDGVADIGSFAFYSCTSLKCVTIPNSIKSIGYQAFCDCTSLTDATIQNSVASIDDYAFWCCSSLTNVTIPDSVTSIGHYTFGCNSLTSVTIPASVKRIGGYAFYECSRLASITFNSKTLKQVKAMKNYPWGIEDESIIKAV